MDTRHQLQKLHKFIKTFSLSWIKEESNPKKLSVLIFKQMKTNNKKLDYPLTKHTELQLLQW